MGEKRNSTLEQDLAWADHRIHVRPGVNKLLRDLFRNGERPARVSQRPLRTRKSFVMRRRR